MLLCLGAVPATAPPQCGASVVVTGVGWAQLPWRLSQGKVTWAGDVTMTGTYANGALRASSVSRDPVAPTATTHPGFTQLCATPTGDAKRSLPANRDLPPAPEAIPGYQGGWVTGGSGPGQVLNIATVGDKAATEHAVREQYRGLLCVGEVPGPTKVKLTAASTALRGASAQLGLISTSEVVNSRGARLRVEVIVATEQVSNRISGLVGPDLAAAVEIVPLFKAAHS